ncbi:hypothetical protein D3C76_1281460 [compost metagenome]
MPNETVTREVFLVSFTPSVLVSAGCPSTCSPSGFFSPSPSLKPAGAAVSLPFVAFVASTASVPSAALAASVPAVVSFPSSLSGASTPFILSAPSVPTPGSVPSESPVPAFSLVQVESYFKFEYC